MPSQNEPINQDDKLSTIDSEAIDAPLDSANKSLADALRASFRILKGIMCVLVLLYLFSNVRKISPSEQALTLRFGKLDPVVHSAGLVWAFPFPIDEVVPLPTKQSNDLMVNSHTFFRSGNEKNRPLKEITRNENEGLNPSRDGALLTADGGLVHTRWKVTYKIDDVSSYVTEIAGQKVEAAQKLLTILVENSGVHIATTYTAEEMIRTKVDSVQQQMRQRINDELKALHSGIHVTLVEMFEPTPPLQVRDAFEQAQRAENQKQKYIREARQDETRILSEAAGSSYKFVQRLLDNIEDATSLGENTDKLQAALDRVMMEEVEGEAGQLIKDAGAYLSVAVGQMKSDLELYRTLLPEYDRNPRLLIARLWEQTRQEIMLSPGVTKIYRPAGSQFRLHIPLDPDQVREDETSRIEKRSSRAIFSSKKPRQVPMGPEPTN